MNKINCFALLMLLVFSCNSANAKIYKWVDKDGNTHYGQRSVADVEQEDISQQIQDRTKSVKFNKVKSLSNIKNNHISNTQNLKVDIKTINYDINTKTKKNILRQIRAIHKAYVEWFNWDPQPDQKIRIRIFGKYKDFEQYQIKYNGEFLTRRSHYNRKTREILMHGTEFKGSTLGVLYHESSHAILHMSMNYAPKWINEGLAEVFELSKLHRGKLRTNNNDAWVEKIKHKLREGSLLSFKEYINITTNSWHSASNREEQAYYYIAWSMMKYLTSNDKNRDSLKNILRSTRQTAWWKKGALEKIFNDNYPGGINKLNRDWRKWVGKLN